VLEWTSISNGSEDLASDGEWPTNSIAARRIAK
jgi:hypothetical protein